MRRIIIMRKKYEIVPLILAAGIMLGGCGETAVQTYAPSEEAAEEVASSVEAVEASVESSNTTESAGESSTKQSVEGEKISSSENTSASSSDAGTESSSKESSKTEAEIPVYEFDSYSDKVAYTKISNLGKGILKADVDCDGTVNTIEFLAEGDQNSQVTGLSLIIDEKEYKIDEVEKLDAYISNRLHLFWFNKPDSRYLYVQGMTDNDYTEICIFKFDGDNLSFCDHITGDLLITTYKENGDYEIIYPSDPDNFLMENREHIFGSNSYTESFRIGTNGSPESLTGYRHYTDNHSEVYAKKDIPCVVIQDEAAMIGEPGTIPSGAQVTAIGSDGKTFVDLKVSGSEGLYRINVEKTTNPESYFSYRLAKNDGLKGSRDLEKCFEGLYLVD